MLEDISFDSNEDIVEDGNERVVNIQIEKTKNIFTTTCFNFESEKTESYFLERSIKKLGLEKSDFLKTSNYFFVYMGFENFDFNKIISKKKTLNINFDNCVFYENIIFPINYILDLKFYNISDIDVFNMLKIMAPNNKIRNIYFGYSINVDIFIKIIDLLRRHKCMETPLTLLDGFQKSSALEIPSF